MIFKLEVTILTWVIGSKPKPSMSQSVLLSMILLHINLQLCYYDDLKGDFIET